MKKYTCKDAEKDIRFVFSKKADEYPEQAKEAYERFLSHAARRGNGKDVIYCSHCLEYYSKVKKKHGC